MGDLKRSGCEWTRLIHSSTQTGDDYSSHMGTEWFVLYSTGPYQGIADTIVQLIPREPSGVIVLSGLISPGSNRSNRGYCNFTVPSPPTETGTPGKPYL